MECASFPLEKVSFYLFSKNEFPDVFGLTYHQDNRQHLFPVDTSGKGLKERSHRL
jgi:hypothetical protein